MTLKEKQLAFLQETTAFYNSTNRCVNENSGGCYYYLPDKPGCAIGRHISDKELCKKLDSGMSDKGTGVSVDEIFNQLPDDLKELGKGFLYAIQSLHDDSLNWNETGLTDTGREAVDRIRKDFNLN